MWAILALGVLMVTLSYINRISKLSRAQVILNDTALIRTLVKARYPELYKNTAGASDLTVELLSSLPTRLHNANNDGLINGEGYSYDIIGYPLSTSVGDPPFTTFIIRTDTTDTSTCIDVGIQAIHVWDYVILGGTIVKDFGAAAPVGSLAVEAACNRVKPNIILGSY